MRGWGALAGVAGALALAASAVRADDPLQPPEGVVAWAWADSGGLVAKRGTPGLGEYRVIASVLNIVAPGAGDAGAIAAIDGATSAAVLAGGFAAVSVNEIAPASDGSRIGVVRACVSVRAPGTAAARVRELLAKAGGKVVEHANSDPLKSIDFLLTFGPDAPTPSKPSERVALHRKTLTGDGSKGDPCGQVFVDLNALRRVAPDSMDNTTLSRVLSSWALVNARDVMLTARIVAPADITTRDPALPVPPTAPPPERYTGQPMVRVDATWSARSEEPTKVSTGPLAAGFWAPDKAALPAGARWVAAVRCDAAMLTLLSMRTYAARLEPIPRGAFSRDVDRWASVQGAAMDRIAQATRGWIVLWPSDAGVGLRWQVVPSAALVMETFGRDAAAVLTPFPSAASADANGVRVVTMPGMTLGFAPSTGGGVVGEVQFDEAAAEKVRSAVGERVKK